MLVFFLLLRPKMMRDVEKLLSLRFGFLKDKSERCGWEQYIALLRKWLS